MGRRKYDSPLRRDQSVLTRKRIVEAIVEQLSDASLTDFSVPRVAQRAGVSEATVYRKFPNRESMLQAVADHWEENHEVPAPPADPEDVALHAERDFAAFEKHAALTRALNEAKLMHAYRAHRLKARGTATRRALAAVTDRLDPEDVDRAVRMILHLDSSLTWKALTEEGLTTREATKAVVWAIRALVEELRRTSRQRAATRARRSSPVGATRRPRPR